MLRINISIPSDLNEKCQEACDKQKISFSQMVRTALMNYNQIDSDIQLSEKEKEIENCYNRSKCSLLKIQEKITDIENNIYVLQKMLIKSSVNNHTNKKDKKN